MKLEILHGVVVVGVLASIGFGYSKFQEFNRVREQESVARQARLKLYKEAREELGMPSPFPPEDMIKKQHDASKKTRRREGC